MNKKSVFLFAVVIIGILFLSSLFIAFRRTGGLANNNNFPVVEGLETGDFLKQGVSIIPSEDFQAKASGVFRKRQTQNQTNTATTSFADSFSTDYTLEETGSMSESLNQNWWVNSGAWFMSSLGTGKTLQGELPDNEKWRLDYSRTNPIDTDNGYHPQNIFRLVERGTWQNFIQQVYYKINKMNISPSPNRNASNGLFLFNRYQSGDNLYYTGIRVDGAVVIKKKISGMYYTMAYKPFISAQAPYNRDTNPNLLPLNTWIGLKSEVNTNPDGTVAINFYVDLNRTGTWVLALQATDNNSSYGGNAIISGGYTGIRTDFMDAEINDFAVIKL